MGQRAIRNWISRHSYHSAEQTVHKKRDHRVDSSGFAPTPKSPWALRASFSMSTARLLIKTEKGLYCPAGDFYIDPRLLLDSRVVDVPRSSNSLVVPLSSSKPFFFNGLQ